MVLDELERGRADHGRDRQEEAEFGRRAPLDAKAEGSPMMVAPDRLTPGTIARHWTRPTPMAVFERHFGDFDDRRVRLAIFSISRMAMPPTMKATATT